ncbi:MAG: PAS domain-containing protein [Proteobacteria bacterium]|nr:PAS domain-containing protein [Pseudomonadota bacterium]MBU1708499.1 PAS domain-containing protein [Pseudomonadota bacterium]
MTEEKSQKPSYNDLEKKIRKLENQVKANVNAKKAFTEINDRYCRFLETVSNYVYTVDIEKGQPATAMHSPNCIAVTGYTPEEYDDNPDLWLKMVHTDDRQYVIDHTNRIHLGELIPPLEHRIYHKDASIRWIRNTIVPRFDDDGTLIAYDALVSDITELKKSEQEKGQLQAQLRQMQKMEAIGTLAGGIAHDFNNILGAILGFGSLAMEELGENHTARADLEQVLLAGNRAKDLVRQILTFSRQTEQDRHPLQVHLIIKETIKLLRASIPSTIISFQRSTPKAVRYWLIPQRFIKS